ncbi:MAG TPA: outer membrane beta-barrel protein [Acidobacteriota bacterium]|nr:outer membrane beta-barrel protein [Acidobacteriota bacterium]
MMKVVSAFMGLLFLLPLCGAAQDLQFGAGLQTSILSYNEDELDGSRMFWGGHARLRAMRYVAGEISLQKRQDNFQVGDGTIELDTVPLQLSAMVFPLAALPVSPYVLAGTGWYFLTATVRGDLGVPYVSGEGSIEHTETAFHIGVGAEAFAGDHVSFGFDVRKVFLQFDTALIRYDVNAYFVNLGATFYF